MRGKTKRYLTGIALAASLTGLAATSAMAAEPAKVASDVILQRPAGVAAMAIGTAAFIATLPVTYVAGVHRDAAKELVVKPYEYTVKRPLGQ